MTDGILLLAHGSPASLDDMKPFLKRILHREPPEPLLREMVQRYRSFGGHSPLTDRTRAQAEALARATGLPVHIGMQYAPPFIADAVAEMEADGINRLIALPMVPFPSSRGGPAYVEAVREATEKADVIDASGWQREPGFAETWADLIRDTGSEDPILFTHHALPAEEGAAVLPEIHRLIETIQGHLGPRQWFLAWQSRPRAPGRWTIPDVDDVLRERRLPGTVVAPIGFVCENAEILYDLDRLHKETAESLGMRYVRAALPEIHPRFIETLSGHVGILRKK